MYVAALLSIAAMGLPGCSGIGASATRATAPAGQPIPMSPGQQIVLPDGATLRYVKVSNDSRCPPGVQCIRAGDADVVFDFTGASGKGAMAAQRVVVNTRPPATAAIDKWQLRVLELGFGATPKATVQVDPAR